MPDASRSSESPLKRIAASIEIDAECEGVYRLWVPENFPKVMLGVEEVREIDSTHLHWRAEIWGHCAEWDAEILTQIPNQRIAWRSVTGLPISGAIDFADLGGRRTRVSLALEFDAPEIAEAEIAAITSRTNGDLERFRRFVETRRPSR